MSGGGGICVDTADKRLDKEALSNLGLGLGIWLWSFLDLHEKHPLL